MIRYNYCIYLLYIISVAFTYGFTYNICALSKHKVSCREIIKKNNIRCIILANEASCLNKLETGVLDFGAVSAETAFLGSPSTTNVNVLAEILEKGDKYKYEIVVVTNKPFTKFSELKDLTYCHPGINTTDIPPYLLQQFESKILKQEKPTVCDHNVTVSENYIKKLNTFFGKSCRYGRWVQDEKLDAKLKIDYKNLSALCNTEDTIDKNYLEKSLECLQNAQDGAVAVTTQNTIIEKGIKVANSDLYYLCKNGSTKREPCVWAKQPYRLIVNTNSTKLNNELLENLVKALSATDQNSQTPTLSLEASEVKHLKKILEISDEDDVRDINKPLSNYTKDLRDTPSRESAKLCERSMTWCTISDDEQKKCEWLSQASLNYGIQPVVECNQSSSKLECIQSVNKKHADLVMIEADLGFTAKRNNLSAIAFPQTDSSQELRTVLLVKNSKITRLENIEGMKGCFSGYGDIAWVSFIDVMRGIFNDYSSEHGKFIADIVGPSCMPILADHIGVLPDKVEQKNICRLCNEQNNS